MTDKPHFYVDKAAVLGAGVMGAQIAAHLANAEIETVLFELPAEGNDPNAHANKAIRGLTKMKPAPLASKAKAGHIEPANYDQHLDRLADCDLVIEAVAERMDIKHAVYEKVAPHLGKDTIFATNTSGLSIGRLGEALPADRRSRFCGVHFFNPPRYMHLVELIPASDSDPAMLDALETFLTTTLGKGVIRAKDTPNFIGNRVGVFNMIATMHHTQAFGLGFDTVDALTGRGIGRPKSATFRTADVVGLDTFTHVIRTMADAATGDPWYDHFRVPGWLEQLIDNGALGQKAGAGIYRKEGKQINVLDRERGDYRPAEQKADDEVAAILKKKDLTEKLAGLRHSDHPQAQFLWSLFRDLFHYCAYHLGDIADSARELDLAIRWGYGWDLGPLETWQAAGWRQIADWIQADIDAGKAMASVPLPEWAADPERRGVHSAEGSYSPREGRYKTRSSLPVYRRQLVPARVLGEPEPTGETVLETDDVRLWHQGDDIAILSFKSKMHSVGRGVIEGIQRAVDEAEAHFRGLVLWQSEEPFSVGANLREASQDAEQGGAERLTDLVKRFQDASMRLKYARVPTVAGVRGMALGGGCELVMHCNRTVAALESYIGLVEVGVGLLPAGGGLKEIAQRAATAAAAVDEDPYEALTGIFETVAKGEVAGSAIEAQEKGFLRGSDIVVFHPHEVLYVAKTQARALYESGYRPPLPRPIPAAGKIGIANFKLMLTNMLEGRFISEHDYEIAARIATVLCGGEIERGSEVDEDWLLALEREHFAELATMDKTRERIQHMLETGKPLRN